MQIGCRSELSSLLPLSSFVHDSAEDSTLPQKPATVVSGVLNIQGVFSLFFLFFFPLFKI
jgi:hypothetical protein